MFAQIIRGRVSDPDAVRPVVDRWIRELGPTAKGWLGSTSGITDDNEVFLLVRFESEEAARANSDRPEQGQWCAEMERVIDGEPTFQDSNNVIVPSAGGPDTAGFVQVIEGQSSDPDRSVQLMYSSRDAQAAHRPDILGGITVLHGEGKFTMVIYFESEQAAREGESKPLPAELQAQTQEMQSLSVGQPKFLDLKRPWLDSPR